MLGTIATVAAQAALAMIMKLATEKFMQDIFIWTAEKLAGMTATKVDDELVKKIKEHLDA